MGKRNVTKMIKMIVLSMCLVLGLGFVAEPVVSHAKQSDFNLDWLGGDGNDTFGELEKEVKNTGNSAFKLVMTIGSVVLLIAIAICAMYFMFSGAQGRDNAMGWMVRIAIGGIILFGAVAIVKILQNIGANFL